MKPNVKTLFDTQPNLTANFLLPGTDTPMRAKDIMSCLKGVPTMSQETLLLQELLYCLLGNGGQHIVPTRGSSGFILHS